MNLDESGPSGPPRRMMKKKDWITLGSLMLVQTGLILGIFAFGYLRLEARMDRMEDQHGRAHGPDRRAAGRPGNTAGRP